MKKQKPGSAQRRITRGGRKKPLASGKAATLSRRPPADVRRALRRETGFVCAHPDCNEPYLVYHHFDPPWHLEHHHRPVGMIALCEPHHRRIDNWTKEELRAWKAAGAKSDTVRASVEIRRDRTFFIVGSNLGSGPKIIVTDDELLVWMTEDESGRLLVNLTVRDRQGREAFLMRDNDWLWHSRLDDLDVRPSGRSLRFSSKSLGISLVLEFRVVPFVTVLELSGRQHEKANLPHSGLQHDTPVLLCSVQGTFVYPVVMKVTEGAIQLGGHTISNMHVDGAAVLWLSVSSKPPGAGAAIRVPY